MHRTDQSSRSKPNPARLSGSGRRGIGGAADAPPLTASGVTVTPVPPTDQSGDLRPKSPLEQQLTRLLGDLTAEETGETMEARMEKAKWEQEEEEEREWFEEQQRRRNFTVTEYLKFTGQEALLSQKGTLTSFKNNSDRVSEFMPFDRFFAWKPDMTEETRRLYNETIKKCVEEEELRRSSPRYDDGGWDFGYYAYGPTSSSGRRGSGRNYTGGPSSGLPDYRGSSYGRLDFDDFSYGRPASGRWDSRRNYTFGQDSGRYGESSSGRQYNGGRDSGDFGYGGSSSGRFDSERNYTGGRDSGRYGGPSSGGRDSGRNYTGGSSSGLPEYRGSSYRRLDSGRDYTEGRDSGRPSSGRSGYSPRRGSHSDSQQTSSRRHEQRYKETPAEIYKKAYSEIKSAMEVRGQSMLDRYDALREILSECPLRDLLSEGDYFSAEQCSKVEDLIARFRSFQDLKPRLVDLVRDLLRGVFNPRFLVLNVDFIMRFAASEHAEYHGSRRNRH